MTEINMVLSFCSSLNESDLGQNVREVTKLFIADYYAASIAGYKVNREFNKAMLSVSEASFTKQESTLMFSDRKVSAEQAAFMNAIYAHGADMDDGNKKSMGHIAAHTMSAVFALAETLDVSWGDVFVAINVGYEVFNRIAAAAQPGLAHRGFHSTGMAGGMACAAACARLLKLDFPEMYNAVSIAAVQSSGLFIVTESGQACKPLNPANAAKAGIVSAKLAAMGVKGPNDVFENPKGWFHAVTDRINDAVITDGLGKTFTIQESYLKPYPSCRHTHAVIECAIQIREELLAKHTYAYVDKIEAINVYIYSNAIRVAGQIKKPANNEEAKFSIHYAIAVALLNGHFVLSDLNVENAPAEISDVIDKINIIVDESWEDVRKGIRGAKIDVIVVDDAKYSFEVKTPKGEGANPFSLDDMQNKLKGCSEGIISERQQKELLRRIQNIDLSKKYIPIRLERGLL